MKCSDYEALRLVIWYDGYDRALSAIAEDMEKFSKNPNETYKNHYSFFNMKELFYNNTLLVGDELIVLWSYLVLKFGNYGTSPRVGWIEDLEECVDYIKGLCIPP